MTTTPSSSWRLRALCRGAADLFDVESGPKARQAKSYCSRCPVKQGCLEAAMAEEVGDSNRRAGIRGGLNPKERAGMARRLREQVRTGADAPNPPGIGTRPLAPCGTKAAYDRHLRRNEPVDEACRQAKNAQQRAQAKAPVVCGTRRGYRKHLAAGEPACDACRHANAAADRRLRTTGSTVAA